MQLEVDYKISLNILNDLNLLSALISVFSKPKKPTFHDIKKNTSRFIVQFDRVKNLCEVQDVQVACNLNQDGETNAEVPKPKSDRITGILDHLRSSTEYECIVGILNDAGWSEWSEAGEFMTK